MAEEVKKVNEARATEEATVWPRKGALSLIKEGELPPNHASHP